MKRIIVFAKGAFLFVALVVTTNGAARAQAKVASVEVSPGTSEAVAGQKHWDIFPRMIGGRRRRIVAVIGSDNQQIGGL